jgi:hypothetical protein
MFNLAKWSCKPCVATTQQVPGGIPDMPKLPGIAPELSEPRHEHPLRSLSRPPRRPRPGRGHGRQSVYARVVRPQRRFKPTTIAGRTDAHRPQRATTMRCVPMSAQYTPKLSTLHQRRCAASRFGFAVPCARPSWSGAERGLVRVSARFSAALRVVGPQGSLALQGRIRPRVNG